MDEVITWVIDNKEWLFSGVGAVVIAWIGRVIYKRKQTAASQKIRSGRNSTNIQAGRDIKLNSKMKRDVGEKK